MLAKFLAVFRPKVFTSEDDAFILVNPYSGGDRTSQTVFALASPPIAPDICKAYTLDNLPKKAVPRHHNQGVPARFTHRIRG